VSQDRPLRANHRDVSSAVIRAPTDLSSQHQLQPPMYRGPTYKSQRDLLPPKNNNRFRTNAGISASPLNHTARPSTAAPCSSAHGQIPFSVPRQRCFERLCLQSLCSHSPSLVSSFLYRASLAQSIIEQNPRVSRAQTSVPAQRLLNPAQLSFPAQLTDLAPSCFMVPGAAPCLR
jgi:hypothetical protein